MSRFIGYEPKHQTRGNERREEGPKIPSDLIKVLPKWKGYDALERTDFRNHLLSMIKQTGTIWLLKNKQYERPKQPGGASTRRRLVLDTPFTPAPIRQSDPLVTNPRESPQTTARHANDVAQVLWRTPAHDYDAHSPHAHASRARAHGPDTINAHGYANNAYGHTNNASGHTTNAHGSDIRHKSPQQRSPSVRSDISRISSLSQPSRSGEAGSLSSRPRPQSKPAEGKWDIPDVDDLSVAESDSIAHHRIEFEEPLMPYSDSASHYTESEGGVSLRSLSQPSSRQSTRSGGSRHSTRSRDSVLSSDALARHDTENRVADLERKFNEAASHQTAMFHSMMAEQRTATDTPREKLNCALKHQTDYTEADAGVEEWVTDAQMEEDLRETHRWWHSERARWENERESLLRSRIYRHLTAQLPKEMYSQAADGDVKAIYRNIISLGTKDSSEQVLRIERDIMNLTKQGRPMATWLDELYKLLTGLSTLGQPRTVAQIRLLVFEKLKPDSRYEHVVRDLKRNAHWTMTQIRCKLEAAATAIDDLLPPPSRDRDQRRLAKAAKKKAQAAESSSSSDEAPEPSTSRRQKAKAAAAKKRALAAKAHGSDGVKPPPRAEAPSLTPEQLAERGKEVCLNHIIGKCARGDSCHRSHDELPPAEKEKALKHLRTQRTTSGVGQCYSFDANGVCSYGDGCKCSHDTKKVNVSIRRMANVRVRLRASSTSGVMASVGDLVVLTQTCPIPALRGALGQVHCASKRNAKRVHTQLIVGDEFVAEGNEGVRQWIQMAKDVGLTADEYVICPPEKHKAMMAAGKSRLKHSTKGRGPYSLNAIFDTGSNTLLSSVPQLFSDLEKLERPEAIEGLDGKFSEATHVGKVTMMLGTHERVFEEAFLCDDTVHTIVPGTLFDDGEYCFMGKHKAMNIMLISPAGAGTPDEVLVSYPRELTIDAHTFYSSEFLADLGPKSRRGTQAHTIYPIPDSAFVWNKAKSHVATRQTAISAAVPEIASEQKKEAKEEEIAKSLDLLANFHHLRGHRSPEHTARMYEYDAGYTLSAAAIAEQPPCDACDVAKITSNTNQQHRVLPVEEVGSDLAADTIVSMPRSLSGFNHIAHIHDIASNYGATFALRTKSCGDKILYWIEWVQLRTGRAIRRLHIDGGEIKTTKLIAFLEEQGSEIIENLADVHSNTTIERGHRDVLQIHNAQMHMGGAGGHMWEFSIPNARLLMNLNLPIKSLRAAGRLRSKAQRPATPYELMECGGKIISMKKLWANVHPIFTKCVGRKEAVHVKQHEARGMLGTYFGPIVSHGNIEQYGHYILRHSDKKVIKVRSVKCYPGVYPMKPSPQHSLKPAASASGGEINIKEPETPPLSDSKIEGKFSPPENSQQTRWL